MTNLNTLTNTQLLHLFRKIIDTIDHVTYAPSFNEAYLAETGKTSFRLYGNYATNMTRDRFIKWLNKHLNYTDIIY